MDTIRAMTWNVWWRFGGNWREREPGLVSVVADQDPDVLGIQECWGTDGRTQAQVIAAAIGAESAFVPVALPPIPDPPEDATQFGVMMGLGLVSRWPIAAAERVALYSGGATTRLWWRPWSTRGANSAWWSARRAGSRIAWMRPRGRWACCRS